MNAHTPSPWTFHAEVGRIDGPPRSDALSRLIRAEPTVAFLRGGSGDEVALANGHLIAAAPDLLDACKAQHVAIDQLFAMLISLTSKSEQPFYPSRSGQPWQAVLAGNAAVAKAE